MNEPGALDERLRTLVMQSFEGGSERLHYSVIFSVVMVKETNDSLEIP